MTKGEILKKRMVELIDEHQSDAVTQRKQIVVLTATVALILDKMELK